MGADGDSFSTLSMLQRNKGVGNDRLMTILNLPGFFELYKANTKEAKVASGIPILQEGKK